MIPEIGNFALILALALSLAQCTLGLAGAGKNHMAWMAMSRSAAHGQFVFVVIAFACLAYSFLNNDFSVLNVASNSNSQLPAHYRFAATWGSHEGSLLLWVLMLAGWTLAVTAFSKHLPETMQARVLGVLGFVAAGFLLFMLLTSNPFNRLPTPALEGRDLNPLLQDPGMVIHPPMLYMGYVGFSVAFAFAISALLSGRLDAAWARWSRPWTIVAWAFLTIGIALGSAWAYYELGWGGWWFWDPVENASFMPWLAGTALIHSLAVTEKRGAFKSWTVLLAILAFSLSLLGTFLVRSGVITSVHAFATDPTRGIFILGFLTLVIGGSLALFAYRAPKVGLGGKFDVVSREAMLLGNNVLLLAACASVLLGTLYPLILDALGLGKISVGPPYFDAVFVPLIAPAIFLMGVGPLARWKKAEVPELGLRLKWAFAVSVAAALLIPFAIGRWSAMTSFGLLLSTWVLATCCLSLVHKVRAVAHVTHLPRHYMGMLLAHFGIAVSIAGITLVNSYEIEKDVRLAIGESIVVAGHTFRFDGVRQVRGPNYEALQGTITVSRDGKVLRTMHPEKRNYTAQATTMTEADIDTGFTRDLYVALGEPAGDGAWSVRIYHKPFVDWIWGGAFFMALGGMLAASDRRYRAARTQSAEITAATAAIKS
jgi:cytochrome c-type biogenesis protein CcmF